MAMTAAERSRRYRERHPERAKERDRRYAENNREKLRAKARVYAKAHPEKIRANNAKTGPLRQEKARQILDELKQKPREDCGRRFPSCSMDFDHRDPNEKAGSVSHLAFASSMKKILAEVAKCDLVCSNCHRVRTKLRAHLRANARKEKTQ